MVLQGGWVLFDIISCQQPKEAGMLNGDSFCFLGSIGTVHDLRHNSAIEALVAGYIFLGIGLSLLNSGVWRPGKLFIQNAPNKLKLHRSGLRVLIVLLLGAGTLCIWRGIWYLLDYYIKPEDALVSAYSTMFLGILLCMLLCSSASMLAPPAIFLMDGPAHLPPPIGVTIIISYRSLAYPAKVAREKTEKDPAWFVALDMFFSYVILPIGVVGFWRGLWALLDTWLWGFTASQADVNWSILWSFLLGLAGLLVGSEDVVQHFSPEASLTSPTAISIANGVFGRVRTLILACGAVNFWRAVWLFWDEFLGNSHIWSPLLSHFVGIVGLLLLGCLSCITGPPSTLGVDAVAHPESSDEPLFHNTPVPAEALYLLSIARRPEVILKGLEMPEVLLDRACLDDPSVRASVIDSSEVHVTYEVMRSIDNLLAQDDYLYTSGAQSVRFEQASASVQTVTRSESSSILRLSERHMAKRSKSQFYRSR
jgi:Fuseless